MVSFFAPLFKQYLHHKKFDFPPVFSCSDINTSQIIEINQSSNNRETAIFVIKSARLLFYAKKE